MTTKLGTYENVLLEREDGITWVTLNRPEKRNAMSPALHHDMVAVLNELEGDAETKVLVLTGAGDSWNAGQDLKEYFRALDNDPAGRRQAGWDSHQWRWEHLLTFPKPTIAMVNGYVFGGAFTPLVACDIAIAAEDAIFGLSEINWGIFPRRPGHPRHSRCHELSRRYVLHHDGGHLHGERGGGHETGHPSRAQG